MKYRALISFCGKISMTADEEREISDKSAVKDLLNAGYIIELKAEKKSRQKKQKGDKNEN